MSPTASLSASLSQEVTGVLPRPAPPPPALHSLALSLVLEDTLGAPAVPAGVCPAACHNTACSTLVTSRAPPGATFLPSFSTASAALSLLGVHLSRYPLGFPGSQA